MQNNSGDFQLWRVGENCNTTGRQGLSVESENGKFVYVILLERPRRSSVSAFDPRPVVFCLVPTFQPSLVRASYNGFGKRDVD